VSQEAGAATGGSEPPGVSDVVQAMAVAQPSARPGPARRLPSAGALDARRPLDLRAWAPPTRYPAAPEVLAAQMQRTFGTAAGDVAITPDSTRPLAAQAEGVAVGEQVYIAPGFYDLTTVEGHERLGHEVAHVLQQRRGRDLPARLGVGERVGLE